jgi:ABC-2 type transport system ATP-binding protein
VGLMYGGKLVECDTPRHIREKVGGEVIEVQVEGWSAARETLARLPGVRETQVVGEALHLLVDSASQRLPEVEAALAQAGIHFHGIRIAPVRMEEAFISLVRRMEA